MNEKELTKQFHDCCGQAAAVVEKMMDENNNPAVVLEALRVCLAGLICAAPLPLREQLLQETVEGIAGMVERASISKTLQ